MSTTSAVEVAARLPFIELCDGQWTKRRLRWHLRRALCCSEQQREADDRRLSIYDDFRHYGRTPTPLVSVDFALTVRKIGTWECEAEKDAK